MTWTVNRTLLKGDEGYWPEDLTDLLNSKQANLYIDTSGSMRDYAPKVVRWLESIFGPYEAMRHSSNWRRVFTFSSNGVLEFAEWRDGGGCDGGDGLPAAVEHARDKRRRCVIISDGGHVRVGSQKRWAWLCVMSNAPSPPDSPDVRWDIGELIQGCGVKVQMDARQIASRMAEASRKVTESLPGYDKMREERELLAEAVVAAYGMDEGVVGPGVDLARSIVEEKRERERTQASRKAQEALERLARHNTDKVISALRAVLENDPTLVVREWSLVGSYYRDAKAVVDFIKEEVVLG